MGRLLVLTEPRGRRTTFGYDPTGRRVVQTGANSARTTSVYDAASQLTGLNTTAAGSLVSRFTHIYDPASRRISTQQAQPTGMARTTYAYDPSGQLMRETRVGPNSFDTTFAYDPAGNRTLRLDSGVPTAYGYDAANQLLTAKGPGGPTTYAYDAAGNRGRVDTTAASTFYAWDARNRLAAVEPVAGPVTFTYDANSRRLGKQTPALTKRYIYDFEKVLQETDGFGVTQNQYTSNEEQYGDLVSAYGGGQGVYYAFDAVGSADALLDDTGSATDRYANRAFGLAAHTQGTNPNDRTFVGRQGYEWDLETGLYFLRARYEDPDAGRFLSPEPARADANPYRYAGNDPVNKADPSGLADRSDQGREADSSSGNVPWHPPMALPKPGSDIPIVLKGDGAPIATLHLSDLLNDDPGEKKGNPLLFRDPLLGDNPPLRRPNDPFGLNDLANLLGPQGMNGNGDILAARDARLREGVARLFGPLVPAQPGKALPGGDEDQKGLSIQGVGASQVLPLLRRGNTYGGTAKVTPEVAKEIIRNVLRGEPPLKPDLGNVGKGSWLTTEGTPHTGTDAAKTIEITFTVMGPKGARVFREAEMVAIRDPFLDEARKEVLQKFKAEHPDAILTSKGSVKDINWQTERLAERKMWVRLGEKTGASPEGISRTLLEDSIFSRDANGEFTLIGETAKGRVRLKGSAQDIVKALEKDGATVEPELAQATKAAFVRSGRAGAVRGVFRWGGRILLVVAAANDVYEIFTAEDKGRTFASIADGWAGAIGASETFAIWFAPADLAGPEVWIVHGVGIVAAGEIGYYVGSSAMEEIWDFTFKKVGDWGSVSRISSSQEGFILASDRYTLVYVYRLLTILLAVLSHLPEVSGSGRSRTLVKRITS